MDTKRIRGFPNTPEELCTSLNLQNVLLTVAGPRFRCALLPDGLEFVRRPFGNVRNGVDYRVQDEQESVFDPIPNNWRKRRLELMRLNVENRDDVARWLNTVGYAAETEGRHEYGLADKLFTPPTVTDQIVRWLYEWKQVVTWAMTSFTPLAARRKIRQLRAHKSEESKAVSRRAVHYAAHPEIPEDKIVLFPSKFTEQLMQTLRAPRHLNSFTVTEFLGGVFGQTTRATFDVDDGGRPILQIGTWTPMQAIVLTVFIDRLFTKQEEGVCKGNQKFCELRDGRTSHQSLYKTMLGRAKERAFRESVRLGRRNENLPSLIRTAERQLKKRFPTETQEGLKILASSKMVKRVLHNERRKSR
jgi:hypothetical protein